VHALIGAERRNRPALASPGRPDKDWTMAKSPEKRAESAGEGKGTPGPEQHGPPSIVAPSHRMNIAFPFSQITLQEPSRELSDLTAIVLDLIAAMAEWVPEEHLADLRHRAEALADSLR
jgi:hypothetical protein